MKERKARIDGLETREALLAAAEEEFAAVGFEVASVRRICRAAHANCALANRYFGSKEELYALVAKRLFGDLGAPLATLADGVADEATWRAAIRTWIDDFLYMTLPTERPQRLCAGLFRQEVTHPTKFHAIFKRDFGACVQTSLARLIGMAVADKSEAALWVTSIWSQVAVYALADEKWIESFRPRALAIPAWRDQIRDFICEGIFSRLTYRKD